MSRMRFGLELLAVSSDEVFGPFLAAISADSLEIRAAANASVPADKRPIRRRILERVVSSSEFRMLSALTLVLRAARECGKEDATSSEMLRLLADSEDRDGIRERVLGNFYADLSQRSEFSTLLLEAIDREERWTDFVNGQFKSWTDRIRSVIEKLFSKEHPAARGVATLLLSGSSLLLCYRVAVHFVPDLQQELSVPVRISMDSSNPTFRVSLTANDLRQTIPIKFVTEPLELDFRAKRPVTVDMRLRQSGVTPAADQSAEMQVVASELKTLNRLIGGADISTKGGAPRESRDLLSAVESVAGNLSQFSNLVDATKQNSSEFHAIRDDFMKSQIRAVASQEVFSSIPSTSSLTIAEGEKGTAFLQWLNEDLEPSSCLVTVSIDLTRDKSGKHSINLSGRNCPPLIGPADGRAWQQSERVSLNEPIDLTLHIPFHVVIAKNERHWWGKSEYTLLFRPNAGHALPEALRTSALSGSESSSDGKHSSDR